MKKSKELLVIFLIFSAIFFQSCSPKVVPGGSTNTQVRDSVVIQVRDSVVITPIERVVDVAAVYDTLKMETSLAKSRAWLDTTNHMLRGEIQNKKQVQKEIKTEVKWQTRDSIVYKELPVPYEVVKTKHPAVFWWLLGWFILSVIYIIVKIYFKMRISR